MDDHFTLQWNDYQSHLMSAFTSLRNDKDFVDLTLSCEGRKISSHKMLLSACSPYFRGLLKDNPCPHPVIILRQTSYEDLVAIIHFVYNGEVSLHQSRVKSFIKTAKSLKIRGLCEAGDFVEEEDEESASPVRIMSDEPSRKKVKIEEQDETDFSKDWSFDYGTAGDLPEEGSTSNSVIAGEGSSTRRRAISLETKLEILRRKEGGQRICTIARDFSLPQTTISSIIRNSCAIRHPDCAPNKARKMREMEEILSGWIKEQNEKKKLLGGTAIREMAKEIWIDIHGEGRSQEDFVASPGWFKRFRRRVNLAPESIKL